jgi:FKBP-type peptidyl-prolyl cis-trans isomerase SlyD
VKISDNTFVAIDYSLKLDSGEEVDKSEPGKPLGFIYNAGQIIPGLEKELAGKEAGWSTELTVEAKDGYGPHREELVRDLPRSSFPPDADLQPGMVFKADGPHGAIPFTIKSANDESVTVDLNHPLSGERLHFNVTVAEVRDATEEELAASASACGCSGAPCESSCETPAGGGCEGCH